jgi:hypothetical protein
MARLGRKRQFDTKSEYRQLLLSGIGTLDACRTVGTGHKSGCRWRAENGGIPLMESLGRMAGERAWIPSVSLPAGSGPQLLFDCRQHAPGRDGF